MRRFGRGGGVVSALLAVSLLAWTQPLPAATLATVPGPLPVSASGPVRPLPQPVPASTSTAAVAGVTGTPGAAAAGDREDPTVFRRPMSRPAVALPRSQATVQVRLPAMASGPILAAYLGDSYTTGWNGAGLGAKGWPAIVGRTLGWRTKRFAVGGTGFVNPGWTGGPFRNRVAAIIAARPDVVVIAGGHNDSHWSTATTSAAANAVIGRIHRALPAARLIVIAPIWHTGRPPLRILALRDRLRAEARAVGALFIDPLAGGWFAGAAHRFIGPDGIHPTNAGHQHIASLVLKAIRRAGLDSGPAT